MKLLMIYMSGNTIPFAVYYCNDFKENNFSLYVEVDEGQIVLSDWDYYHWFNLVTYSDQEKTVEYIKEFIEKVENI